ncbi:MAG TPA: hypothetical protein VG269_20865 [Tepidisphaeraceae bacterium]|jgi:hypothetical protein|nr:hypothetical protein [Tepidisphaeraceae bacterium]
MNSAARVSTRFPARLAFAAAVPFALAVAIALACYFASGGSFFAATSESASTKIAPSGATLGLFFGPVLLLPFLAPALALAEENLRARLIAVGALTFGIWLVWLLTGSIHVSEALRCGLVLAAWVFALAGFASLLCAAGLHPIFASALTAAFALAWLTWPVWLSHFLTGQSAPIMLTAPHPLLSLNGVLLDHFNAWDRYGIAYRDLTTLNQDILFTMPASISPMVISHIALGSAGFAIAYRRDRKPVA